MIAPQLKRSEGELYIETVPSKLPLLIDGISVGDTPVNIKLSTGKHIVTCNTYGIIPNRIEVEVKANEKTSEKMKMKYSAADEFKMELYAKAYAGSTDAICYLIMDLTCELDPPQYEEAFFWKERHPMKDNIYKYEIKDNEYFFNRDIPWEVLYCEWDETSKALEIYKEKEKKGKNSHYLAGTMEIMGDVCYKKNKIDDAISFYNESLSKVNSGTSYEYSDKESLSMAIAEKLGDCYKEKGDKQQAASYYRKVKNYYVKSGYTYQKEKVESKLKELGY